MSSQEKIKKELLAKYISGSISSDERHQLERLALDDTFLFEAMEGYSVKPKHHELRLNRIKNNLEHKKMNRRSRIPYGIAASVLMLIGAFTWLLYPKESESLMVAEAKEVPVKNQTPKDEMITTINTEIENTLILLAYLLKE